MGDTDIPDDAPEPPRIRMLRRLVTLLTLTLTLGMIVVVGLLVWRLTASAPVPALPETVALPRGERLTGYARNPDWTVLITQDADGTQRLHIVAPGETAPHQSVTIMPLAE
ncbi:hypothetical protein HMH01_13775 [Halovulum dunhuangense]|uniref:Uncharacterized protein n=1 Tax=Halovulum dunhuangense TaxID=1505036 RepID=A0A849L5R7_9RHOB|nr:DUF6476 family protein [Halovulum dunhuangense]NNU81504.1 hypothetical protein [Halovulum dunhuangense]